MRGVGSEVRLWGGRFEAAPAADMDRLNRSLPVDRRMWREDVAGSRAWVTALGAAGVLTSEEELALFEGLGRVAEELEAWSEEDWAAAADEDIHTLVERLLTEELGPVAGKLHTGRSRNDQVATDTRMWAAAAARRLDRELALLQAALLDRAESQVETLMPAYTHMQRAQPVSAAHWLMSHFWPLARDRERLAAATRRTLTLPLGSGAIAGCPYPVDRVLIKEILGFRDVCGNSMDAVADRDFVAELLFVMAMVGGHLSRLAEDVILFASGEFGFVRLPDAWSTGSSLMPQKRNPDAMELARGRAGRLLGELVAWLTVVKGLPSGYNKDLQEDKEALFRAFDTLEVVLPAVTGCVAGLELDTDRMAAAVDSAMLATDVADALVAAGVPFREAHAHVGALVKAAERIGCPLAAVPGDIARAISPALAAIDLEAALDPRASRDRRAAEGGTAVAAVREQIAEARRANRNP